MSRCDTCGATKSVDAGPGMSPYNTYCRFCDKKPVVVLIKDGINKPNKPVSFLNNAPDNPKVGQLYTENGIVYVWEPMGWLHCGTEAEQREFRRVIQSREEPQNSRRAAILAQRERRAAHNEN